MALARRAEVEVTWAGVAITTDITPYLVDLTYTDHLSGAADDLSLSLHDRDALWSTDWRPSYGDQVEARLTCEPWLGTETSLRLGLFSHDKVSFSGPPKRLTLKAVSAAMGSGLRRQNRTQAWAGGPLRQVAQDIADRSGLTLLWTPENAGPARRREQKDESDLGFLQKACDDAGLGLKVTEGQIAVFDEHDMEAADPVATIDFALSDVVSWSFDGQDHDRYGGCKVRFYDPAAGRTVEAEYRDPVDDSGPTLEVTRAVTSRGEAEALAKALLRRENRWVDQGKLVVRGDPLLVAGVVLDLTGAYGFEGRYIVTKAEHRVGTGYICSLDLRRCLSY